MGEALNFAALGVTSIRRGDPCAPAQASVVVVSPGGTTSRDVLAEFAENEVANNRKKLRPVRGLERHLWVWLEFDALEGLDVMAHSIAERLSGRMPRDPIVNPDCTVWLAVPHQRWALRWRHAHGWDLVRPAAAERAR